MKKYHSFIVLMNEKLINSSFGLLLVHIINNLIFHEKLLLYNMESIPHVFRSSIFGKKIHDIFAKKEKNKKRKLEIKSKTIDQAREDNKQAQLENNEWKKKYDELDDKIKKGDKEVKEVTEKLKDPNLSKKEREELEEKLALLIANQDADKRERDNVLGKIKQLSERIKNNNSIISGTTSNLEDRHWVWDLFTLENIMIGVAMYVGYKLLKDEKK